MACSCKKKTVVYQNKKVQIYDRGIYPFDSCLNCTKKHLGLALMLYNMKEKDRAITNIFLAYKHLEKRYSDMAKVVYQLYKKLLRKEAVENDIKLIVKWFIQQSKWAKESDEQTQLNFEKDLSDEQKKRTYLYSAYQLLFHQFGYDQLNKPYAIGYLQIAVQLQQDQIKKQLIRSLWIQPNQQNFQSLLTNK